MKAGAIRFLTPDDIFRIHRLAMLDQGVEPHLRDEGLLDSALAMPRQQFSGEYMHPDIPSMAAAYAFHIASNHPFEDGNKRAATAAMILFLCDNGWSFDATADEAEPVILRLASGELTKQELTKWVGQVCHEKPSLELRDFFLSLDTTVLGELWNATRTSAPHEIAASTDEAKQAIPLIGDLVQSAEMLLRSTASADMAESDRVVVEREARRMFSQAALLQSIYRVAEDMGYEW